MRDVASFRLSPQDDRFPVGTLVGVYPAGSARIGGSPTGDRITVATTTSSGTSFGGLRTGTAYVAYALVNGEHRYTRFSVKSLPGLVTVESTGGRKVVTPTADNQVPLSSSGDEEGLTWELPGETNAALPEGGSDGDFLVRAAATGAVWTPLEIPTNFSRAVPAGTLPAVSSVPILPTDAIVTLRATLGANAQVTFDPMNQGLVVVVDVTQDAVGGWALSLPQARGASPVFETGANARTVLTFISPDGQSLFAQGQPAASAPLTITEAVGTVQTGS
jgi:hypothetical protein